MNQDFDRIRPSNVRPQDLAMEEALLGAIILETSTIRDIQSINLQKNDFYKDSHSLIFEACLNISEQNKPIDLLSVRSELERMKVLENIGGAYALVRLTTEVSSSANALYHAAQLKELSIKRSLHDFASILYQKTLDPNQDVFDLLDACKKASEQNVLDISLKGVSAADAAFSVLLKGNQLRSHLKENGVNGISGVPTFSKELDLITQGRKKTKLDVLGAFTSNGKSLAMVADAYCAAKAGYKSTIISLEMTSEELAARLLSIDSGIPYFRIVNNIYSDSEFNRLLMHHEYVKGLMEMITLYEIFSLDIRKTENIIYKESDSHTFYIDYIQLVELPPYSKKNEALGLFTKNLKQLAKKYGKNITILAQLNRDVTNIRTKEELHSKFLADSKNIADDADTVVLMMVYDKFGITQDEMGNSTRTEFEYLVGFNLVKHRGGGTHEWEMWTDLGLCIYKNDIVKITKMEQALKEQLNSREEIPEIISNFTYTENLTNTDDTPPF